MSSVQPSNLPSFTCLGHSRDDLWPTAPADLKWADANALGRERASDLFEVIRRTQTPTLLGHVVEAISAAGVFGGVETGFMHAISIELMKLPVTEFVEVPIEPQSLRHTRKLGCLRVVA